MIWAYVYSFLFPNVSGLMLDPRYEESPNMTTNTQGGYHTINLQKRKLKLGEVRKLVQWLSATKCCSWNFHKTHCI